MKKPVVVAGGRRPRRMRVRRDVEDDDNDIGGFDGEQKKFFVKFAYILFCKLKAWLQRPYCLKSDRRSASTFLFMIHCL